MASTRKPKEVLKTLAGEFSLLANSLGKPFDAALDMLDSCGGNIIVIAYGKSGAAGRKMVSSLRCSGRKAYFLDPVDAFHGEAAGVGGKDVAVIISGGGESDEIMRIIPWLKKKKVPIIAITSSPRSSLARAADVTIASSLPADNTDSLISFTSGITAMALGDLLALTMLHNQEADHGRSIDACDSGEALYTIEDLVTTRPHNPTVPWDTPFRDALFELTSKGLGAISIVDDAGRLIGIITDGDVRRLLQKSQGVLARIFLTNVDSCMTKNPKRLTPSKSVTEALELMENHAITVLPVVDDGGKPVGMIHLHDLVQLGILHRSPGGRKPDRTPAPPGRKSGNPSAPVKGKKKHRA